ncbi:hypothetical protein BDB00DRAFT_314561 [Zychaea mexicana]|uniref:uncharacterized protein n=1 Tax=Zychaea mexicana TaxID=64656 RepID=UPI0022FE3E0D|nr:uncharacterized protein BDB00DRAFT_314561 [Zychaea mexicana]KAI9494408.1 hypothetical protein BDB00DRAFT_314561 [Zychaea mexicana]
MYISYIASTLFYYYNHYHKCAVCSNIINHYHRMTIQSTTLLSHDIVVCTVLLGTYSPTPLSSITTANETERILSMIVLCYHVHKCFYSYCCCCLYTHTSVTIHRHV